MINFVILGTERTQIWEVLPCLHKTAFAFFEISGSSTDIVLPYEVLSEDTEGCLVCKRQENDLRTGKVILPWNNGCILPFTQFISVL